MVTYTFSIEQATQQFLAITVHFQTKEASTTIRIPAWRPGRYELGNFAKNVRGFKVFDAENKRIHAVKFSKDAWVIDTHETDSIRIEYAYYAAELNAGSTYLSKEQLYVNPVNCCIFDPNQQDVPVQVQLRIPESWKIAGSMHQTDRTLVAANFDELADSPFICSPSLQHNSYIVEDCLFHIWFQGQVKPDWDRLIHDFSAFTEKQIQKFSEFPVKEYHFLIQILPTKAYHGVEHCKSTVITLGPSYEVFGLLYKELLGVSSHELYHTWNVKSIRPIEMFPYDFSKENYSGLGYICEGVTTYMGDLFLLKSKVFDLPKYLVEFTAQLQKHFDNPGRFNYSVAQSSFDTWLDGYVPGVPGRKVSIYTEGCLLAFVTDIMLLRATGNKFGLDEVMKRLYFDYALQNKGVSREDYKRELENLSGLDFTPFFERFIEGTEPYEEILTDALEYLGMELIHSPSRSYAAGRLGMKTHVSGQNHVVTAIYSGGPADLGGLMLNDEIIAVNDYLLQGELDKWLQYFDNDQKRLTVQRAGRLVELTLPEVNRNFYMEYSIHQVTEPNVHQRKALEAWKG